MPFSNMSEATQPLLEPDFLRRLEQWSLAVRRSYSGQFGGERRSTRHGHSVEFADFRHYVPGDDVRFVDWNLYARLERLFLKLFLHEQELNVHVLLDLSESMTFGTPPKQLLARKLAAAMGFLALAHQDGISVTVGTPEGAERARRFPLCRGRSSINRLMRFLQDAPAGGALSINDFVRQNLIRIRGPGMIILITDFFDPAGFESPLSAIISGRHEAIVLHILDQEEWEPKLRGDLRLVDSEDDSAAEVSITSAVLKRYRRRVEDWTRDIGLFCRRRGLTYLRVLGDVTPEDVILKTLRRMGGLK